MAREIGNVIIRDLGLINYADRVMELEDMIVKAGFPEGESVANVSGSKVDSMAEMVMIAMVHEFGLGTSDERSFLRAAIDENMSKITRQKEILFNRVATGRMTPNQALNALGGFAVGLVKAKITKGPFKRLKQKTIDRKGSTRPLIDNGQMRQTVQFVLAGKNS